MRTLNSTCPNFWIQQISSFHTSIVDMERTSAYEGGKSTGDHQLKLSQVVRCTDPLRYVYTENASKSQPGSLAQMRVKNKPILAVPESGTRCHVDLYMKKLPAEAFSRDNFYVQPRPRVPDDPTKLGQFLCATFSKSS